MKYVDDCMKGENLYIRLLLKVLVSEQHQMLVVTQLNLTNSKTFRFHLNVMKLLKTQNASYAQLVVMKQKNCAKNIE